MAQTQLKTLSPRHDAIAEWLIANPDKHLYECALAFGVTQPWLSVILHSDIFQVYYRKMRGDHVDLRITPLRDKLLGVANRAVEKLADKVEAMNTRELVDVAELTLNKLGYGQKATVSVVAPGGQVAVFQSASPEDVAKARENYRRYQAGLTGVEALPSLPAEPAPGAVSEPSSEPNPA